MIRALESVLISSEDAKTLAKFYREVIGLKQNSEMEMGDRGEKAYEFDLKGTNLVVMDHSGIKGQNPQGARIMFNLEVDDIEKEFARVKKEGVKVIQEVYHVEDYGLIATFEDADGNYFQFVQVRAT